MKNLPEPYATFFARTRTVTELSGDDRFPAAWHDWGDAERKAVVHAWASERPLLVRGEPGCGKSQLARAVAKVLNVPLEMEVIHPRFEATELQYREDPVRRLAQAQILGAITRQKADAAAEWIEQQLSPARFTDKGAVWRAMVAHDPVGKNNLAQANEWPRAVLLIDEIDKADADVPNALLGVLGNRSFTTPSGETVRCPGGHHFPLVIVTTNEERELPPAFLRRCAVLNLRPPDDDDPKGFTDWLVSKAKAHELLAPLTAGKHEIAVRAAEQALADRKASRAAGLPTVGLAEYLDLMYSLLRLSGGVPAKAGDLLDEISAFALVKHREQKQDRAPVGPAAGA